MFIASSRSDRNMISQPANYSNPLTPFGISALSIFQPPWVLPNEWFDAIPTKFVKHTGILRRPVSTEDEVALAMHATENLVNESGCDLADCAGVVFTSPSFVPASLAHKHLGPESARNEQLNRAANRFVTRMGLQPRRVAATNTFCAGYAKAMAIIQEKFRPTIDLGENEFILLVTASQISRITNYSCRNTAALFGDMATATLISRVDSQKYPVHFELLHANVDRVETNRPFFDFAHRTEAPVPTLGGGTSIESERIVFSLDGMAIADAASRAMAASASEMLDVLNLNANEVEHLIPHQAGVAIVRLAEMKLRDSGFTGEVTNGLTCDIGNVSSASIPYAISKKWHELSGTIFCPIASVSRPGTSAVAKGCIALRSTANHQVSAAIQVA